MGRIVIAGAGVAGLGTALYAGRAGHEVTLVERDDTPLPPDPAEAFWWDRRGAPQVRHSHAFLARLHNQLRDDHPDVLERLLVAGATEMDFIEMLPEGMDRSPMDGDEDLVALACRRTTFEWVLRHTVLDEGSAELRHGSGSDHLAVTSLLVDGGGSEPGPGVPHVGGVELSDGSTIEADHVVLAGGRRMDVPSLYRGIGVELDETEEDTGIVYLSRFFRLCDGAEYPPQLGPIGGDLGYLKFGVFPGDDRTFSITLATNTPDRELRKLLLDEDTFSAAAALLPPTAAHLDGRAEAITGVEVMGGLINRRRRFLVDGNPVVTGVSVLGDAHTATNPLYGRGCSLALVQSALLVDALDGSGSADDVALGYETGSEREIVPWYDAAVAQDRLNRASGPSPSTTSTATSRTGAEQDRAGAAGAGDTPDADIIRAEFVRSLMRDGLFPAMRVDPVVLRAFLRVFNLLEAPDSLMSNMDVIGRVMAVYQDRDQRPAELPLGPDRDTLIASITAWPGTPT